MLRHRQMMTDRMRTNWKTEEKKMSMSKNIARLAVTAGLTAALSFGGVMAPVTMAFAEGTPKVAESGSVTIKEDIYKDTTFKGIKIFSAKVTQDQKDDGTWDSTVEKTLSDIDWASGPVKSAVTTAFNNDDPKPDGLPTGKDAESAQAWAQFIKTHGNEVVGNNVKAGSVLDKIAAAVEKANILEGNDGWLNADNTGSFDNLATGYWLFVTKSVGKDANAEKGNTDTFSSPIFAVVGGSAENLTPKKQVPTVTKAVKDDKEGSSFGDNVFTNPNMAADSRMDQFIDYQLTGTVAGNIDTYSTYRYTFTDNLPKSMTPSLGADGKTPVVKVKIGNTEVKTGYTAKYDSDTLTVDFLNLKNCTAEGGTPISLNGNSKVTVEYQAKLDSSKVCNTDGSLKSEFSSLLGTAQTNTVKLTYSNNPHGEGEGTTVDHPAYDYTYGIDVTKVGSDEDEAGKPKKLEGVEFTLQEKDDTNNFIKADGTKTKDSEQAKLKTDASGKINVVGLDEGTYVLTEVKPAPGYNNSHSAGITFTITRGTLPADDTTVVNPGCTLATGTDENLVKVAQTNTEAADGKVHLTVTDQKGTGLPLTGLNGVTFTWIAGGAVLCIGVAHLIRSRKQAEESEQE
ncbi:SpaA isopeptide-forming pilin-related protein [Collinsella aerofaciens]|uniref:SpaA isopeptide-forming pilin-related protein n=1 Tax=Collinsella aerofaciens TaxID=74426 RepID=UPI000F5EBE42|nr:SpaA isopeptide-forming pilin-related protein [Collinsella aerofaciens]AZH69043.1 hypothetical protein CV096_01795 [Collinsella aerofaciens]